MWDVFPPSLPEDLLDEIPTQTIWYTTYKMLHNKAKYRIKSRHFGSYVKVISQIKFVLLLLEWHQGSSGVVGKPYSNSERVNFAVDNFGNIDANDFH
ncbi:hypothetical protein DMENIID0001_130550 [Sergentomyia squamirostris]